MSILQDLNSIHEELIGENMKKYYVGCDLGRDILIFEAKNKKELTQCLILEHNISVENDIASFGHCNRKKTKTLKNSYYFIEGECTEEEYENGMIDNVYSADNYFDKIRWDYQLEHVSNEELVKLSFGMMPPLRTKEEIQKWIEEQERKRKNER